MCSEMGFWAHFLINKGHKYYIQWEQNSCDGNLKNYSRKSVVYLCSICPSILNHRPTIILFNLKKATMLHRLCILVSLAGRRYSFLEKYITDMISISLVYKGCFLRKRSLGNCSASNTKFYKWPREYCLSIAILPCFSQYIR